MDMATKENRNRLEHIFLPFTVGRPNNDDIRFGQFFIDDMMFLDKHMTNSHVDQLFESYFLGDHSVFADLFVFEEKFTIVLR